MAKILIVEDEPAIAVGLMDNIAMEGYDVELVRDGVAAEQRALSGEFDLVLLDLMLPKKDGFDVCRAIRQAGVETAIIVLTARRDDSEKVLGLEIGADDYVTKPFNPRELLARIRAVLRRSGEASSSAQVYRRGDLTVDFTRYEVFRGRRRIELTAMEFRILRTFVRQRGQVLTPDQIAADAWGKDTFITDRVIYTHISNLRSKIEEDAANPRLIVTVRGFGYRFEQ
jgi:DNA-binding response OmpR family regulator